MTWTADPEVRTAPPSPAQRLWERYGSWLWLAGVLQFAVAILIVEFAYACGNAGGCYNALTNPLSDLGSGGFAGNPAFFTYQGIQYPWPYSQLWPVFDYSIFVLGAFLFTGVFLVQSAVPRSGTARVGLALLALGGLAAAGVGVIPEDTLLAVHLAFALAAFLAIILALVLTGWAFARDAAWGKRWGTYSVLVGLVAAVVLVLAVLPYAGLLPRWPTFGNGLGLGALERIVVVLVGIWLVSVTIRILRRPQSALGTSPPEPKAAQRGLSDRPEAGRRSRWEKYGAWVMLLGLVQFVAIMLASQFAYSCANFGGCYNFLSNPISDLGSAGFMTGNPAYANYLNQSYPWPTAQLWPVFNYSIMLFGTGLLAGAVLVRSAFPRTNWSGLALFLIALGGMGAAGVGVVPEDALLAAHSGFALIAFGLAAVGILVMGVALLVERSWGNGWAIYTLASGIFALAVVVIFTAPSLVGVSAWAPYGNSLGYGGMERLIIVAPLLWIGVAMLHLLTRKPSEGDGSVPTARPEST